MTGILSARNSLLSNAVPVFVLIFLQSLRHGDAITSRVEPKDLQVVVGSTVTLTCGVDNIGTHSIYWYRHIKRKYITKNEKVFHQVGPIMGDFYRRVKVIGDSAQGDFNLRIDNVTYTDADRYSCVYFQGSRYVSESNAGELKVYEAPAKGFPKCSMAPETDLGPGSTLTIQCLSARSTGAPNSRLDWHRWYEMLPGSFEQGNSPKASYATLLTELDNGAVFTCVESSPVLTVPRTCNVTPFLIPTNVTVVSLQENKGTTDMEISTSSVEVGHDAVFSCQTEAMPPVSNYTWFVEGEVVVDSAKMVVENGGERLRITDVSMKDNGTSVECRAWNVVLIEGTDDTVLIVEKAVRRSAQASGSPHFDRTSNLGVIIGPSIAVILIISVVIYLVVRLRNKKLSNRPDSDTKPAKEHTSKRLSIQHMHSLQPAMVETDIIPEEESNPEPDETEPLGVTICSTPHAAIVEHLRELGDGPEEANKLKPPATRVLMVGRLSSTTSDSSENNDFNYQHRASSASLHQHYPEASSSLTAPISETEANKLYSKPLKRKSIMKSQISGPISIASDCDSIYMNCPSRSNSIVHV